MRRNLSGARTATLLCSPALFALALSGCGGGEGSTGAARMNTEVAEGTRFTPSRSAEGRSKDRPKGDSKPRRSSRPGRENKIGEEIGSADPMTGHRVEGYLQPPTPAVQVHAGEEKADELLIRFRFPPPDHGEPRPWMLLTTVNSAGSRIPPLTLRTPVAGRESGVISQPVGLGHGPFELLVATLAPDGLRSPFARIRLAE